MVSPWTTILSIPHGAEYRAILSTVMYMFVENQNELIHFPEQLGELSVNIIQWQLKSCHKNLFLLFNEILLLVNCDEMLRF